MTEATIGYTLELDIDEGAEDAFKHKSEEVSQIVEKTEPDTLMYQWFVAEDGRSARVCEWFTDSEAAIAHLTGRASNLLPEVLELVDLHDVEVYGTPNEKLAKLLKDFPVSGTYRHLEGFTR